MQHDSHLIRHRQCLSGICYLFDGPLLQMILELQALKWDSKGIKARWTFGGVKIE